MLAILLVVGQIAIQGPKQVEAAGGPIQYVYDADGGLIGVVDPAAQTATMAYDADGNITSIARYNSSTVSIIGATPQAAGVGAAVKIYGTSFSSTPSQNSVTFNGTVATVTAATFTELDVTVPVGATTGTLKVTAPGGTASSAGPFTVLGPLGPTVTGVSATVVDAGAPLTISGTNFQTTVTNNEVLLGHYQAQPATATASSLVANAPPVGAGPITVITPYGKAASAGDVFVPPAPYTAAQVSATGIAQFGQTTSITIPTAGTIGLLALEATAGQRVTFSFDESGLGCCNNNFALYSFDGSLIFSGGAGFYDVTTIPVNGTYVIRIAPNGSNTGTAKVTVYDVPSDVTTSMSFPTPGNSVQGSVTTTTPGQNASLTFNIATVTPGMRIAINSSPACSNCNGMNIYDPNGTLLWSGGMGNFTDDLAPTVAGTYTIKDDYGGAATGTSGVTLYNVPLDVTTNMTFPSLGNSVQGSVTTTTPGQDASVTFNIGTVTAGMRISINGSPACSNCNGMYIYDPNGTQLWGGGMGNFTGDLSPTVAGTYTIKDDYGGMATGTSGVTLYNVPPDVTTSMTFPAVGSSSTASVTTITPGQNASITFNIGTVTAGMRISINSSPACSNCNGMNIYDPNGTQLWSGGMGNFTGDLAPTVAGTYTIKDSYGGMATGTSGVTLYNVPLDATASMSFPALGSSTPGSVTTTTPNQNGSITFSIATVTAGMQFSVTGSPACNNCNNMNIYDPNGTQLWGGGMGNSTGNLTPTVSGTYTIKVTYLGMATGTAGVTLYHVGSSSPFMTAAGPPAATSGVTSPSPKPSSTNSVPRPANPSAGTPASAGVSQPDWTPRVLPGGNVDDQIYLPQPDLSLADLRAPPGVTALAGRSLQLNGQPLGGVTMSIGTQTARTDETGRFLLKNIPAGRQVLRIDGTSADHDGAAYGIYEVAVQLNAGTTTSLGFINWMTRLDMQHAITIASPTPAETVLTTPLIPGLEVHLPAGTVIKDDSGNVITRLSITAIPVNRPPFPLPLGVQVPIYFTVQPGATYIYPKGAQIVYPNYGHEMPGSRVEFWDYDADQKDWYLYGHGTVTATGQQVVPDPGVVVWQFSGAMINSGFVPWLEGLLASLWNWKGDPVDMSTGNFESRKTDLALPGSLPITFNRVYNAADTTSRSFGIGATSSYDINLYSTNQYQVASLYVPGYGPINYVRTSSGTGFVDAVFQATATPGMFYKSTIVWNGNGWNLTLLDGTEYVFGENAPLQSIRDAYGNRITLLRTSGQSGNVTTILSTSGRWIKLTYDGNNRITQALDNSGRKVIYAYDASGRLHTVTDANNGVTTYGYDANNRMTTIVDPLNLTYLTNHYDANGRVYQQDEVNTSQHFTFTYTLNGNGQVTKADATDPRGIKSEITYNADGYNVSDTEDLGGPTQSVTTIQRQPGTDAVTSITDPLGRVTQFGYDSSGNVNSVTQMYGTSEARTFQFSFEPVLNRLHTITDPRSKTTTINYDDVNRTETVIDPLGHQTVITFNSTGQEMSVQDALLHTWTYGYVFSDPASVTDPLGNTSSAFYDGAGRLVSTTDATGQVTLSGYDPLNDVTSVTDPLGLTTTMVYDADGNLLSLKDPRGSLTKYTYNNFNQVATRTDPNNRVQNYPSYDADGNLTQFTDQKGQIVCFKYDNLNRPTFVGFAANASCPSATTYQSTTSYGWDAGSRLHTLTDSAAGTVTQDWDDFDRPKDQITPQGTVSYTFDTADRLQTITVPGQTAYTYGVDDAGRLQSISQGASTLFSATYDNANRQATETLADGIVGTYSYDNANRLGGITYTKGSTTLGNLAYTFTSGGLVSTVGGTWGRTNIPAALTSATYDAANQVKTRAGKTFTYDSNGNLINDGTTSYSWNARNQLTSVGSGSSKLTFAYDGLGRRTSVKKGTTTTSYLYAGANAVQETQGSAVTANQVPTPGVDANLARTDSTGTSSYLTDGLGSTVALANSSGAVQTQYTYDPFGATTSTGSTSSNTYDYTGRQQDSGGLYYDRARYYSPSQQRFISSDPIGFGGGDANLYRYAAGSPTNLTDPSGEIALADTAVACVVGGAISAFGTWAFNSLAGRKTTVGDLVTSAAVGCAIAALFTLIGPAVDLLFGDGAAVAEAEAAAVNTGDVAVYLSRDAAGDVNYVGITNNIERRAAEQLASKGIDINPIAGLENLSRADARSVEQVLIEENGGPGGGQLLNKINSIARSNPNYGASIQRGCALLATVGFAAPNVCG